MSPLSRRNFVRSAGLVTLFSPFLDLLTAPTAKAAGPAYQNLLLFFTPGTSPASWKPKGSSDMSVTWSPMTEPLAQIKESVVLVDNLSSFGTAGSHGAPGGLTGKGYGAPTHHSVEQYISDKLTGAPIKNVLLGGVSSEQQTNFFRGGMPLTPISSLSAAHQSLFGGFTPGTGEPAPGPAVPDDKLRRKKSSLDFVTKELRALSAALGPSERVKLELHADSIRQLELTLEADNGDGPPIGESCVVPGVPAVETEVVVNAAKHLQLAIQAFACGRTRVAAVQFGHHQNTQVSIPEVGQPGDWHNTFMHSDMAPFPRLIKLEQWLCEQFVAAAKKLQETVMPDGETLFDKTLMVWARDMGDGPGHGGDDMRFVFAGGPGKYLKLSPNGRYIDGKGAHHQSALLATCQALGVDFGTFGDTQQARGVLGGLSA
ncbi:MAG TPA: DUF1552 domain-containing protein [Polyangiaceae bacterium]